MKAKNPRGLVKLEVLPGTQVAYFSRRENKLKTGKVLCLKVYADYEGNIRTKVFVGLSKGEASWCSSRRWVDYGSLKVLRKGYKDQVSWQDAYTEEIFLHGNLKMSVQKNPNLSNSELNKKEDLNA